MIKTFTFLAYLFKLNTKLQIFFLASPQTKNKNYHILVFINMKNAEKIYFLSLCFPPPPTKHHLSYFLRHLIAVTNLIGFFSFSLVFFTLKMFLFFTYLFFLFLFFSIHSFILIIFVFLFSLFVFVAVLNVSLSVSFILFLKMYPKILQHHSTFHFNYD